MEQIKIFAIAGSLRAGSFNRKLLAAAVRKIKDATVDVADLKEFDLPLYDGDLEAQGLPPGVIKLKERIAAADALLIATPEYNWSIPGVFKNAIDWASRPPSNPFRGKTALITAASAGYFGGVRSILQLRQVFVTLGVFTIPEQVTVAFGAKAFDEAGKLADPKLDVSLQKGIDALIGFTVSLKGRK
ncbi:MAG: NAD(P)H-dependent oxidoreductase [candidate division Zixibacteria bacterium]|nr:NAD(P)H-dependent oxidoreductase [candidate division Zixibacteria bacterium]MCI0594932.1 NAD(P)H-dependent oxidoreductase [candidate division Zixibacteria bacterium]